jgi:hypothetical protein
MRTSPPGRFSLLRFSYRIKPVFGRHVVAVSFLKLAVVHVIVREFTKDTAGLRKKSEQRAEVNGAAVPISAAGLPTVMRAAVGLGTAD